MKQKKLNTIPNSVIHSIVILDVVQPTLMQQLPLYLVLKDRESIEFLIFTGTLLNFSSVVRKLLLEYSGFMTRNSVKGGEPGKALCTFRFLIVLSAKYEGQRISCINFEY